MKIREELCTHYLELAQEFSRRGVTQEAVACVLMVQRLGHDCPRAREILLSTAGHPVGGHPAGNMGDLAPIMAFKRKLDRWTCVELAVAEDGVRAFASGADRSVTQAGKKVMDQTAGQLKKEMERLKRKCELKKGRDAREIVTRLGSLLGQLRERVAQMPGSAQREEADLPLEDLDEEGFGELSIEHEVHNIGNDFYKIGMFEEAIAAYDLALKIRPDLLETYFNRGLARTRLGHYNPAWEDITYVLSLNDKLAEAWYTRGLINEYVGEFDRAIADYEKALEQDQDYEKARSQIIVARRKKAGPSATSSGSGAGNTSSDSVYDGLIRDFSAFILKSTSRFRDVSGCEQAMRALRKAALYLSGDPVVEKWGGQVSTGILLAGPPGVGKTQCVLAVAGEVRCTVYALPPTVLMDAYAGNTERNIRTLWDVAAENAPSIIYVDEIDGFLCKRHRHGDGDSWYNKAIATILDLMSKVSQRQSKVVLIGATNRFDDIDFAFLRPGRFDEVCWVTRPDARALAGCWLIHLEKAEQRAARVDLLCEELRRAVRFDRQEWMNLAMADGANDGSGIPELARICEQRELTGADVVGVIRATIDDRIYAEKESIGDLGPITPSDLKTQLLAYEPPQWRGRGSQHKAHRHDD